MLSIVVIFHNDNKANYEFIRDRTAFEKIDIKTIPGDFYHVSSACAKLGIYFKKKFFRGHQLFKLIQFRFWNLRNFN